MTLGPGPDKPWPPGKTGILWDEVFTDERLLKRATAVFEGALRIYNNIVDRWFPNYNRRNQMSYTMPIRFEGMLSRGPYKRGGIDAVSLRWWPCLVSSRNESGVFFELGSKKRWWR